MEGRLGGEILTEGGWGVYIVLAGLEGGVLAGGGVVVERCWSVVE